MKTLFTLLIFLFVTSIAFSQKAISITKLGKGKPMILMPGFATPGSVWDETIKNLDGNYETHAISYAGFNGMPPIGTPWYVPIKDQLIEYVKKENLNHIILIGHSMGGNLAVELAAALPDRIEKLIIVESLPCMREVMMPGVPASAIQYENPYSNQMLGMTDEQFAKTATTMADGMTTNKIKAAEIAKWSIGADRKTYVYGYTDLLKLDLRDELSKIKVKTLILGAPYQDKAVALANYEKQYAKLASKEIRLAENSRHFIMFDEPEWFYEQVNGYLTAHE